MDPVAWHDPFASCTIYQLLAQGRSDSASAQHSCKKKVDPLFVLTFLRAAQRQQPFDDFWDSAKDDDSQKYRIKRKHKRKRTIPDTERRVFNLKTMES
jgi:hypothetical protein